MATLAKMDMMGITKIDDPRFVTMVWKVTISPVSELL